MGKPLKRLPILTDIQIGWLAGAIDADGTITINKCKPRRKHRTIRYRPAIYLCNTCEEFVKHAKQITKAGNIVSQMPKSTELGKKRKFVWIVQDNIAVQIIKKIFPYLIVKKKQAEVVIKFSKIVPKYVKPYGRTSPETLKEREKYVIKIRELNKQKGEKS